MHSVYKNFVSNGGKGAITPIRINVGHSFMTGPPSTNPTIDVSITQVGTERYSAVNTPKSYPVFMTPDEAREVAKRLNEEADKAEAACK